MSSNNSRKEVVNSSVQMNDNMKTKKTLNYVWLIDSTKQTGGKIKFKKI